MREWSSSRRALLIATDKYQDGKLKALRSPAMDIDQLARVLSKPEVAAFEVSIAHNETESQLRRKIGVFFGSSALDEVLLLHLACHGVKDDDGNLYFAATDTETENLDATAVSAEWVNRQITRSRSRRIVVLLDCCYSGAFSPGLAPRGDEGVQLRERFEGRGRVVLTASNSMEYAWEGDALSGKARPSIFTGALVEGLEGQADRDRDGWITVDELYDYVFDRVQRVAPQQSPMKWGGVEGTLYLAQSPRTREVKAAELPVDLERALSDASSYAREGAARELGRLLNGDDEGLAKSARQALERLQDDDSRRVASVAHGFLAELTDSEQKVSNASRLTQRQETGQPGPQMSYSTDLVSAGVPDDARQPASESLTDAEEKVVATHAFAEDAWGLAERVLVVTDRHLLIVKKGKILTSIPYDAVTGLSHKVNQNTWTKSILVLSFRGADGTTYETRVRGLGKKSEIVKYIRSRIPGGVPS